MPNLLNSIKDPKELQKNLANSFRLLEKDLKREKNCRDQTIFPLDFSEIYSTLFPEFSQTPSNKISRLLLQSKNANIRYGLFPPTIAEFFIHLYSIHTKIEGYANREKKIPIGSSDVKNYVKKMSPGYSGHFSNERFTPTEDLIHTIVTLSDQRIVENSITNPCKNFLDLKDVLEQNRSLLTLQEVFPSDEEKTNFFGNSDRFVYDCVLNYLNKNEGRNPTIRPKMADYNMIDALLAHQSYILNRYYYEKKSKYFSIFTSSNIPIQALEQNQLCFSEKPFNNTPLFRDPLYMFCRDAYFANISDEDELMKMAGLSSHILSDFDSQKIIQKYPIEKESGYPLKAVYTVMTTILNSQEPRDGLKEMMIGTLIQRFSRHKMDEILWKTEDQIDYYRIVHNLDDFINLEKQTYEENFYKTQEVLAENLNKLYLELYPLIEESDFWAISPKMAEMKQIIHFG